jgi:hypothetical protein
VQAKPDSKIFNHYFPDKAVEAVQGVFHSTISNEKGACSNLKLSQISVIQDAPPGKAQACVLPSIMAELEDWTTSNPKMIICPSNLKKGNIEVSLPGIGIPAPVVGDDQPENDRHPARIGLGERTSWRTSTLGSVFFVSTRRYNWELDLNRAQVLG